MLGRAIGMSGIREPAIRAKIAYFSKWCNVFRRPHVACSFQEEKRHIVSVIEHVQTCPSQVDFSG